jgi:hypothetical protein
LLNSPIEKIAESLRKQGVEEEVIAAAIADWQSAPAQGPAKSEPVAVSA